MTKQKTKTAVRSKDGLGGVKVSFAEHKETTATRATVDGTETL